MRRLALILLAPLLGLVALGAWAYASPVGAAPDDDYHLASIWCAIDGRDDLCQRVDEPDERELPYVVLAASCYAFDPEASASCQEPLLADDPSPMVVSDRGSFDGNYPPVFYGTMSLFASGDLQVSALVMRFVSIVLFLGITTALFLLLPVERRSTLLWMWLVTTVPLGAFLLASNNPSAWAIIGVGSAWLALLGYLETTGRRRIGLGVLFAVSSVMAAGARADAAAFVVLSILLVVAMVIRRDRRTWVPLWLPGAVILVAVALYFLSSQSGAVLSGLGDGQSDAEGLDGFGLLAYNVLNVPSLWAGVFGSWNLGWLDTALPAIVWLPALAAFVAVVFTGLRTGGRRRILAIALLAVVLWVLPVYLLTRGGDHVGQNVQPRYLLPLIVVLAGIALLSAGGRAFVLTRVQVVLVALAVAGANAVALHMNLRRYVTGTDVAGWNLDEGAEWWWPHLPVGPTGVWVIGSLAFAALVAVLAVVLSRPPLAVGTPSASSVPATP